MSDKNKEKLENCRKKRDWIQREEKTVKDLYKCIYIYIYIYIEREREREKERERKSERDTNW